MVFSDANYENRINNYTIENPSDSSDWNISMMALDADTTLYFQLEIWTSLGGIDKNIDNTCIVKDNSVSNIDLSCNINTITLSGTI